MSIKSVSIRMDESEFINLQKMADKENRPIANMAKYMLKSYLSGEVAASESAASENALSELVVTRDNAEIVEGAFRDFINKDGRWSHYSASKETEKALLAKYPKGSSFETLVGEMVGGIISGKYKIVVVEQETPENETNDESEEDNSDDDFAEKEKLYKDAQKRVKVLEKKYGDTALAWRVVALMQENPDMSEDEAYEKEKAEYH